MTTFDFACPHCHGSIGIVYEEGGGGWIKREKCMNCGRYPGESRPVDADPEIERTRRRLSELSGNAPEPVCPTEKETHKEGEVGKKNPTLEELAELLGVSTGTVCNWRAKGVPALKRWDVSRKLAERGWTFEAIEKKAPAESEEDEEGVPPTDPDSITTSPVASLQVAREVVKTCEKKVTESPGSRLATSPGPRFRVVFHGADPERILRVLADNGFELYGMERI